MRSKEELAVFTIGVLTVITLCLIILSQCSSAYA